MKRCTKCGADIAAADFPKNKSTRDGLGSWCKSCVAANAAAYYRTDKGKEAQARYFKSEKGQAALKRGLRKQIEAGYYRYGRGAIHILRQGAQRRGVVFALTPEDLEAWWHSTPESCAYCGLTIDQYRTLRDFILTYDGPNFEIRKFRRFFLSPKHAAINWMTIDRADNAGGYELSNIVKCCWLCNSLKGSILTHGDMLKIAGELIGRLCDQIAAEQEAPNQALQPARQIRARG